VNNWNPQNERGAVQEAQVMTGSTDCASGMILGALVVDAASMGLHGLKDQARIAQVAGKAPAFHGQKATDHEGTLGVFCS
jgi:uncharacterized protein YcsI (UPF0317 family)